MVISRNLVCMVLGCWLPVAATTAANAQSSTPDPPAPVAYTSATELNNILAQVRQTAQNIDGDLGKVRVEKWKTDSATKRDIQGTVDSIRRNLQSALPEIILQLSNAPEDLAGTFKLYRNLDALYVVFGQVEGLAEDKGSKDESQSLSNDLSALQSARLALGERMQNLAAAKEAELARLRGQIKAMQAATPPAPPKKIVVDDTEPPKKPVKKKATKPATTPPAPASAQSPPK